MELETLPPPCAAHVTCTSGTGFPLSSVTRTTNGLGRGCPTTPFWALPSAISIFVGVVGGTLSPPQRSEAAATSMATVHKRTFPIRLIITMTLDPLQGVPVHRNGWVSSGLDAGTGPELGPDP